MSDHRTDWERRQTFSVQFWHGCAGKHRHTSKKLALGRLRVLIRDHPHEQQSTMMAYKCRCGFWHLGHSARRSA